MAKASGKIINVSCKLLTQVGSQWFEIQIRSYVISIVNHAHGGLN